MKQFLGEVNIIILLGFCCINFAIAYFMLHVFAFDYLYAIQPIQYPTVIFSDFLCRKIVKSFIQGFLPGIALKIFLILLPTILMIMSKIEGFIAVSSLERRSASKYYIFLLINVFLGSIITGTAFEQLNNFIHQSANAYVSSIPWHILHTIQKYSYASIPHHWVRVTNVAFPLCT